MFRHLYHRWCALSLIHTTSLPPKPFSFLGELFVSPVLYSLQMWFCRLVVILSCFLVDLMDPLQLPYVVYLGVILLSLLAFVSKRNSKNDILAPLSCYSIPFSGKELHCLLCMLSFFDQVSVSFEVDSQTWNLMAKHSFSIQLLYCFLVNIKVSTSSPRPFGRICVHLRSSFSCGLFSSIKFLLWSALQITTMETLTCFLSLFFWGGCSVEELIPISCFFATLILQYLCTLSWASSLPQRMWDLWFLVFLGNGQAIPSRLGTHMSCCSLEYLD